MSVSRLRGRGRRDWAGRGFGCRDLRRFALMFDAFLFVGRPQGKERGHEAGNDERLTCNLGVEIKEGLVADVDFLYKESFLSSEVGFTIA